MSRTIGWFTSIYPVRFGLEGTDTGERIKAVKEQLRAVPNKGIGYGILVALAGKLPMYTQKTVRFNYLGEIDNQLQDDDLHLMEMDTGNEQAKENELTALVDLVGYVKQKQFMLFVRYSSNQFSSETIDRFVERFFQELRSLIAYCCEREEGGYTPSDFETASLSQEELDELFT
ncbi:condensation domain-containing protein [Brevibacillus parabrevis]|uniref:condensation domain-containing protein n=1 Tax=Brevibacillus parabrevis TaxID=54914 RepID=UPI002E208027|nr:condensation domain-containing protein [Brevibacillus parabrevis]MED1724562.1 condensation domain-containing protein [Brevibacillus parabrevis]